MLPQLKPAPKRQAKKPAPAPEPVGVQAAVEQIYPSQSSPPSFTVQSAMTALKQIRITASDHHQQYVVPGRKALLDVLSQLYELYYNAKNSSEFEPFMNNVRNELLLHGVEIRTTSQKSSLLVRLVFADFSDKKVHVWGRALEGAFDRQTLPCNFKSLVAETKNGLEGLRNEGSANPTPSGTKKLDIAISVITNEPTIETIAAEEDWEDDEQCRIYVAVLNEDSTVDLKDSKLEKKHLDATLLLVKADKDRRDNPPKAKKASKSELNKAMQLHFETLLKNEQTKHASLDLQLKDAIAAGDKTRSLALKSSIEKSVSVAEIYENEILTLRNEEKSRPA